jgi:hypothetical protein
VLAQFLDARFPGKLIDERLLEALRRPGEPGVSPAGSPGSARANLARWFPRGSAPGDALALVELLADPDKLVRFWALAHLKELAGTDHGYDEKAIQEPPAAEVLGRWRRWAEGKSTVDRRQSTAGEKKVQGSQRP